MKSPLRTLPLLLLPLSACLIAGCSSIESHTADAVETATSTDRGYATLDNALDLAINRVKSLRETPGGAESYLKTLELLEEPVARAGDDLGRARESLLEHGREHTRLLQEEANKFNDPELGKRFSAEADRIRGYYDRYDRSSESLFESIRKARGYFTDVRRAVELNRSPAGVETTLDTLRKAGEALKDAKSKIPDSQAALTVLRKNQPRPAMK